MNYNPQGRPPPLHWLTFLRYPATVWVIMKHSLHNFGEPYAVPDGLRKDFMERGFLGVPFFFILSGFILAYNYPVIVSWKDYLSARAARILPLYYLSLLLSVPVVLHALAGKSLVSVLPNILTFLTLTQAWVPDWTSFWNFPAWTLSCEVFFYTLLIFLLPLIASFVGKSIPRMTLLISGCFVFGLLGPTWFTRTYGTPTMHDLDNPANAAMIHASTFIKIFPVFHLSEFLAGVALCVAMRSRLDSIRPYAGWILLIGVLQIVSSVCLPEIFSQGTYCLPGFVLIVLAGAALPYPDLKSPKPGTRWVGATALLLGNVSYAVYLFHFPVIFYLGFINRHVHPIFPHGEAGVWSLYFATLILTTLIGLPVYWFYEQPARVRTMQWLHKHWAESPVAGRAAAGESPAA